MEEAPEEVSITFSEPLLDGSELQVTDECERRIDDGSLQITLNEMRIGIEEKSSGTYTVTYSAVGSTSTATGGFTFTVHGSATCDPASGGHHGDGSGGGGGVGHGGGGGGGGHGGGNGGSGGGHSGGGGGTEPSHGGDEAAHNEGTTDGSAAGATAHATGDHISGVDTVHTGDHSAGSGRANDSDHGSRQGSEVTASDTRALSPFVSAVAPDTPGARATGSWATITALAIAGLFGVAGGWLLRGARLTRASDRR